MPERSTLLLASGGLRSLVATALVLAQPQRPRLTLLHLRDGRPNAPLRHEHVHRQAEHFRIPYTIELDLPHLQPDPSAQGQLHPGWLPLARPQILLVGLAQALELGAGRVVWPAHFNADYPLIARLTEQIVLLQHLTQLEHVNPPLIDTPLLELSDQQLIELGGQMDVPWELAWSCLLQGDKACRVCAACRRRRAAFDAAGMVDPAEQRLPVM